MMNNITVFVPSTFINQRGVFGSKKTLDRVDAIELNNNLQIEISKYIELKLNPFYR